MVLSMKEVDLIIMAYEHFRKVHKDDGFRNQILHAFKKLKATGKPFYMTDHWLWWTYYDLAFFRNFDDMNRNDMLSDKEISSVRDISYMLQHACGDYVYLEQ